MKKCEVIEGIPKGFNGIIYEPSNEQELIALFLLLMNKLKPTWCIDTIQTAFPDATFIDTKTQKKISVEFEYMASSFNHDVEGCKLIICWDKDLSEREIKRKSMPEILSIKEAISELSDIRDVYLGKPRENSLDNTLKKGVENNDKSCVAVNNLINKEIPKSIRKYEGLLYLDHKTTKHYQLQWNRKSFLGVYPNGRLITGEEEGYVRDFGENAREQGKKFRHIIKDVVKNLYISKEEELNKRISILKKAIEEFCKKLEKASR